MRGFSKTQVASFFLGGAAVGAVVGLLFAPKAGTHTRRDIRKFSKKAVDQLEDLQSDIRDQISESRDQVVRAIDNVKDYVEGRKIRLRKMIKTA
jgi:gas vesicle protein